jgi:hypothetical protein
MRRNAEKMPSSNAELPLHKKENNMTKERIYQLEQYTREAIADCQICGETSNNQSLAFWRGVKMVVDELKMGILKNNPEKIF